MRVRGRDGVRVSDRGALAFAGGAAMVSALDGAVRTLTSAQPALTLCAGVALLIVSLRQNRSTREIAWCSWSVAAFAGGCAGLALSNATPSWPRDISMHVPRAHVTADLFDALDQLDAAPSAFDRRTIDVTGSWMPATVQGAATVSRRVMSCCAADAVDVGFDVIPKREVKIRQGAWVRISGRVRVRLRDGELRYEIVEADVRPAPRP
ncbi:MAG TPA: hypothetical protein VID19_05065 [Candidatus Eremiobacteraceae bacterium]